VERDRACAHVTMTSSSPLDLSLQTVRSADHDHDRIHHHDRSQHQQPHMSSRQLQRDKASRRARRGRRRPRAPDTAPPTCSDPAATTFNDGLLRHYDPPMFAELNTGVAESGDDRNKPTSWRMDENTPVSAIPDDSAHVLPYGRRGKTGQTTSFPIGNICHDCLYCLRKLCVSVNAYYNKL